MPDLIHARYPISDPSLYSRIPFTGVTLTYKGAKYNGTKYVQDDNKLIDNNTELELINFNPSSATSQLEFVEILKNFYGNEMFNFIKINDKIRINIYLNKINDQNIGIFKTILYLLNGRNMITQNQNVTQFEIMLIFYKTIC